MKVCMIYNRTEESNKVFNNFLNSYFFENFKIKPSILESQGITPKFIEFFFRGNCPSNCDYCYLARYGKELYPIELNNDELLIQNLIKVLNWYTKNNFCANIELFSGRFLDGPLGEKILKTIYEHFSQENIGICKPEIISIPDDMQFLLIEEQEKMVQSYIDKFMDIGIILAFSASIDGKYCDNHRFGEREELFYEKVKNFIRKNNAGIHPMLSPDNIDKWIKNFDWFCSWDNELIDNAMLLEVRNNEWEEDKITHYLKFLNHMFNYYIKKYTINGKIDMDLLFRKIIRHSGGGRRTLGLSTPMTVHLKSNLPYEGRGMTCSVQNQFTIRMGDLSLPICHRTAYENLIGGKLIVEDDKIVGIEGKNIETYITCMAMTLDSLPKCTKCEYVDLCLGPCYGSNYETEGQLFYTGNTICNLLKEKFRFIILKLSAIKAFDWLKENQNDTFEMFQMAIEELNNYIRCDDSGYLEKLEELIYDFNQ